jgi:carboxypeptidase family protein
MKDISRSVLLRFSLILIIFCHSSIVFSQLSLGSLEGTVTDALGALVPRAKVVATLRNTAHVTGPYVFVTETNDDGTFNLKNLPPGIYDVHVRLEGSEAEIQRVVYVPGKAVELVIEVGRGCDKSSDPSGIVTEEDLAEVIRLTSVQAIKSKSGFLKQEQINKGIIVSTKNIKSKWLTDVRGIKIKLMSQKEIKKKADVEGDFLYVLFSDVRVIGACIAVTVVNTWAVGKHSQSVYLSGAGITYEYRKESGKWRGKFVSGWLS